MPTARCTSDQTQYPASRTARAVSYQDPLSNLHSEQTLSHPDTQPHTQPSPGSHQRTGPCPPAESPGTWKTTCIDQSDAEHCTPRQSQRNPRARRVGPTPSSDSSKTGDRNNQCATNPAAQASPPATPPPARTPTQTAQTEVPEPSSIGSSASCSQGQTTPPPATSDWSH